MLFNSHSAAGLPSFSPKIVRRLKNELPECILQEKRVKKFVITKDKKKAINKKKKKTKRGGGGLATVGRRSVPAPSSWSAFSW
jgi:hypothetical protein